MLREDVMLADVLGTKGNTSGEELILQIAEQKGEKHQGLWCQHRAADSPTLEVP